MEHFYAAQKSHVGLRKLEDLEGDNILQRKCL